MRTLGRAVMATCFGEVALIALVMGFWWLLGVTLVCGVLLLAD